MGQQRALPQVLTKASTILRMSLRRGLRSLSIFEKIWDVLLPMRGSSLPVMASTELGKAMEACLLQALAQRWFFQNNCWLLRLREIRCCAVVLSFFCRITMRIRFIPRRLRGPRLQPHVFATYCVFRYRIWFIMRAHC